MTDEKISVEDCMNCMWPKKGIQFYCKAGHKLSDGVNIWAFNSAERRGKHIHPQVCQNCEDVDFEPINYP